MTKHVGSPGDATMRSPARHHGSLHLGHVALYALLLLGAGIAMLPLFWMISTSLMTLGETLNQQWLPRSPQWHNYAEAWTEAKFATYFLNSVLMTTALLVGLLLTSILGGYAFARIHFVGREVMFFGLLSTMMIPEAMILLPNFLVIRGDIMPLPGGSWLNTLQGLTVPFMANAFSIFLLRQFFKQLPVELWDAARMDGCGHLRFLITVVLPISKAPILTVGLLGFISAWDAFLWPLLVTTKETWRPLMVGLWSLVTEAGSETHLFMAGATITLLPVLLLYFLLQKQFTESIITSGFKG
jgi:ABC-type glycerol-3-phosphate transport system permease component